MTTTHTDGALRPTAEALRLVEARTTAPRSVDVDTYVEAVTAFCPYLAPSLQRGMTGWTVYGAAGDVEAVEAEIFYAAAQAAEWVRSLASQRHGALVCENVAVLGAGRKEVTWPHWVLKNLYGPLGLMFGKFPEGEGNPPAPVTFIPVRVAVRPRDPRFLRDTPELAVTVANSADDGRDVLSGLPHDWTEIKQWAHNLLPKQ